MHQPAPLTFRQPAGASEPAEPYVPYEPEDDANPERVLQLRVSRVAGGLVELVEALDRGMRRRGEDYRADGHDVLDRADRAAEALRAATAEYRQRRAL